MLLGDHIYTPIQSPSGVYTDLGPNQLYPGPYLIILFRILRILNSVSYPRSVTQEHQKRPI